MLNGKRILLTGGTGSFGQEFVKIALKEYNPKKLVIFSRDELKQSEMMKTWNEKQYPCLRYVLGDVRDEKKLVGVFRDIDYVIHTAALKQIPMSEINPAEFIKTNIIGTMNIINAAKYAHVEKILALSTDKACNPINLYGASKLCADKLIVGAERSEISGTKFSVIRYGNVLGSRGSAVTFFREKAKTGVLPITDLRMTRFWLTVEQAVRIIIKTLSISEGEDIFVPKIPSMKLVDLATSVAPGCKLEVVGIRAGEKLHEVLLTKDDSRNAVEFDDHYVVQSNPDKLEKLLAKGGKRCPDGFIYSTDENKDWLTSDELKELIKFV